MKPLNVALALSGTLIAVYLILALGSTGVGSGAAPVVQSFGNFSSRIVKALQGR